MNLTSRQRKESFDMKIAAKCSPIREQHKIKTQEGKNWLHIILRLETIEINQAQLKQYDLMLNTPNSFCAGFCSLWVHCWFRFGNFNLVTWLSINLRLICDSKEFLKFTVWFLIRILICFPAATCAVRLDTFNYQWNCLYWARFQSAHAVKIVEDFMMIFSFSFNLNLRKITRKS